MRRGWIGSGGGGESGGGREVCLLLVGGGGCTQFVHGRSRMAMDPRIPTMPGRGTSGFHQLGREGRGGRNKDFRCFRLNTRSVFVSVRGMWARGIRKGAGGGMHS